MNQLLFILIHVLFITSTMVKADDDDSDSSDSSSGTTSSTTTTTSRTPWVPPSSDSDDSAEIEESQPSTTADVDDPITTPSTTVTTQYTPTDDELCGCFDFELICNPFIDDDEICYYYKVKTLSTETYCDEQINSIVLGRGASEECSIAYGDDNDIDSLLTSYSPQCYSLSVSEDGLSIDTDADNLLTLNFGGLSSSMSLSGSSSVLDQTGDLSSDSVSIDTSSDSFGDVQVEVVNVPDFIMFGVCFDATSNVDGVQSQGEVFFNFDDRTVTCPQIDAVPDFCGAVVSTTPQPTTAAPTTAAPTTASPTTASPTTAAPTTAAPTTAAPTTAAPTTASPTTAAPTTAQPTIAPTFDQCMSNDSLNIAFLLDESGSVSNTSW
eukprot:257918_1